MPSPHLRLAAIGCGNRTQVYLALAARLPDRYVITAAADRNPPRLARVRELACNPEFQEFSDANALLAEPPLADLMIIGTQDADHFAHATAALRRGYDLLLEKPIATSVSDMLAVEKLARDLGRRVIVCHVLRYTPFYRKVQELVARGTIGKLVAFEATQGIGPWHQAHSYVRGHWSVAEKSTPMTVANSCHDLDIISWLADAPCTQVSSFGGLAHFRADQAPAGAPARCTDGCPVAATCPYDAHRYLTDKKTHWLNLVYDRATTASDAEIIGWLRTSKWGRCVYHCDNTTVDHQAVNLQFANGITGNFTLTAFSEGRDLALFGTKGRLLAGSRVKHITGHDILFDDFTQNTAVPISIPTNQDGWHGDADSALMYDLPTELQKTNATDMLTSIERSVDSHLMGFAAEVSRQTGRSVDLAVFRNQNCPI
jgi:predicted dehydrogenase